MSGLFLPKITRIDQDRVPFRNLEWTPAAVNFVYGENGTGKTTLAEAISQNHGLVWEDGFSASDVQILHYDQRYVERFFNMEDRIPGIFSTRGIEKEAREQIRSLKAALEANAARNRDYDQYLLDLAASDVLAFDSLKKTCWKNTAAFRKEYSAALRGGLSNSEKFASKLLSFRETSGGDAPACLQELKALYPSAFSKETLSYEKLVIPEGLLSCLKLPGEELLEKPIVGSDETDFSGYIHSLHAADWVWEGKETYLAASEGSCPFCSQKLPENFTALLESLFDAGYNAQITALRSYDAAFKAEVKRIYPQLAQWLNHPFPEIGAGRIPALLADFRQRVTLFTKQIGEKLRHPGLIMALPDFTDLLADLQAEAERINQLIDQHNEVVREQKIFQDRCRDLAWRYLLSEQSGAIRIWQETNRVNAGRRETVQKMKTELQNHSQQLLSQIRELESHTENCREAIEEINRILAASRYQGFSLRERPGVEGIYEIVYSDGSLATSLSDGEYRMLTFLYFCQQAVKKGGWDEDVNSRTPGSQKMLLPRILVLDDPTNGMDRRGKQVVRTMTAQLARMCLQNKSAVSGGADLVQLFLFTHDMEYYRDLMENLRIPDLPDPASQQVTWAQLRRQGGVSALTVRGK